MRHRKSPTSGSQRLPYRSHFPRIKSFKKSVEASCNHSESSSAAIDVVNFRPRGSYMPWKKYSFDLNSILILRNSDQDVENLNVNEIIYTVGYQYSF
ncbi:hypothetical protein VUJ46_20985 [Chryseobacterium sp. MYb264]|uniref:hypothetical protein n=1 Tax=Chryseobacterium sp. MYb264 TaxID=2745153 RepID=UPI002E128D49|nr:hypothetical protein VUJ46_20985 [Chryseobacterium sp. MYb264]